MFQTNTHNKKDLGLLLDLGHTNVTATWLNFNRDEFVDFCKNKTLAVHISNNNGKKYSNMNVLFYRTMK